MIYLVTGGAGFIGQVSFQIIKIFRRLSEWV